METPVEIDFERCDSTERFRERIEDRVAMLEARFGRITACRVTMRGPGNHHRTGGPYQVFVHIELPGGRQVDIDRAPDRDERYADPIFAINDAFKRARRILQDNVRHHMQGQVKLHEDRPVAVVRMIEPGDGYGFLKTADERELYFHRNSVLGNGFDKLRPGDRVSFAEAMGDEGPQASTVRVLANHRKQ